MRYGVWARKRDNRVLVVVEDTGPGIPDEALTKIFNRFYTSRLEAQFGNNSGLGLAISKQIVEAHGGVILGRKHPPHRRRHNLRALGCAICGWPAGLTLACGNKASRVAISECLIQN